MLDCVCHIVEIVEAGVDIELFSCSDYFLSGVFRVRVFYKLVYGKDFSRRGSVNEVSRFSH